jgi:uncharacterized protein (DUF433 family)
MPQETSQLLERNTDTELVPPSDPRAKLISIDPERMSGTPCFVGTRVPIRHLWDYLEGGDSVDEFLDAFEGISREQVIGVLHLAFRRLLEGLPILHDEDIA